MSRFLTIVVGLLSICFFIYMWLMEITNGKV